MAAGFGGQDHAPLSSDGCLAWLAHLASLAFLHTLVGQRGRAGDTRSRSDQPTRGGFTGQDREGDSAVGPVEAARRVAMTVTSIVVASANGELSATGVPSDAASVRFRDPLRDRFVALPVTGFAGQRRRVTVW